jgi:hypothetical protein
MAKKEELYMDIETMPLVTLDDYRRYNIEARKINRDKGKITYKIKVPPTDLHKHYKVRFQRFDQQENVLKCIRRNAEIDWRGQLKSGCIYTLPLPVINFLNNLAEPIFSEVTLEDGTKEVQQTGQKARFSCQMLDAEAING